MPLRFKAIKGCRRGTMLPAFDCILAHSICLVNNPFEVFAPVPTCPNNVMAIKQASCCRLWVGPNMDRPDAFSSHLAKTDPLPADVVS